jgi:hypothetical protein
MKPHNTLGLTRQVYSWSYNSPDCFLYLGPAPSLGFLSVLAPVLGQILYPTRGKIIRDVVDLLDKLHCLQIWRLSFPNILNLFNCCPKQPTFLSPSPALAAKSNAYSANLTTFKFRIVLP